MQSEKILKKLKKLKTTYKNVKRIPGENEEKAKYEQSQSDFND